MTSFLSNARTSLQSAKLLLRAGDTRGAVNRGYYAMFDAARGALAAIDPDLLKAKTHASIIRRFGKHLVEARGFDRSLGRIFSQTEDARLAADYEVSHHIDEITAKSIVDGAERFVLAVEIYLAQEKP
jgi:uncharacterized protein (UPF0332 family)